MSAAALLDVIVSLTVIGAILGRRQLLRERRRTLAWQIAEMSRRLERLIVAVGAVLLPSVVEAARAAGRFAESMRRLETDAGTSGHAFVELQQKVRAAFPEGDRS